MSQFVNDVEQLARTAYRHARRLVILVVGGTVLLIGLIMLVTPGPAIVVIPLGLAILALEFAWARRLLRRAVRGGQEDRREDGQEGDKKDDKNPSKDDGEREGTENGLS